MGTFDRSGGAGAVDAEPRVRVVERFQAVVILLSGDAAVLQFRGHVDDSGGSALVEESLAAGRIVRGRAGTDRVYLRRTGHLLVSRCDGYSTASSGLFRAVRCDGGGHSRVAFRQRAKSRPMSAPPRGDRDRVLGPVRIAGDGEPVPGSYPSSGTAGRSMARWRAPSSSRWRSSLPGPADGEHGGF